MENLYLKIENGNFYVKTGKKFKIVLKNLTKIFYWLFILWLLTSRSQLKLSDHPLAHSDLFINNF